MHYRLYLQKFTQLILAHTCVDLHYGHMYCIVSLPRRLLDSTSTTAPSKFKYPLQL